MKLIGQENLFSVQAEREASWSIALGLSPLRSRAPKLVWMVVLSAMVGLIIAPAAFAGFPPTRKGVPTGTKGGGTRSWSQTYDLVGAPQRIASAN
jgi:hypothetical protein